MHGETVKFPCLSTLQPGH